MQPRTRQENSLASHVPVLAGILMERARVAQEAGELLRAGHGSQALQQGGDVLRTCSIAHGLRAQGGGMNWLRYS